MNIKIENVETIVGIIQKVILNNDEGMSVELYSYGASIYQIYIDSKPVCVVPNQLDDFLLSSLYYGKTLGRMSGRISTKPFKISGKDCQVTPYGSKDFQLHGGKTGFSFQNFKIKSTQIKKDSAIVVMTYVSKDLEEGYPGELTLDVTYCLNQHQTLTITYDAHSTQDTVANFTNHAYFNLLGSPHQILDHQFIIPSSRYMDRGENFEYNGIKAVDEKFDFKRAKSIKPYLNLFEKSNPGFDHVYLLDPVGTIKIEHPDAPYRLEIYTDYQAVVFFTHNLENKVMSDQFPLNGRHSSFALECQHEPGGTHEKGLFDLILKKGEQYHKYIQYSFKNK